MKIVAWMLRWGDEKALPVEVHPYIYPDDLEESLSGIVWLLQNTKAKSTVLRTLAGEAICMYLLLENDTTLDSLEDDVESLEDLTGTRLPRFMKEDIVDFYDSGTLDVDIEKNLEFLKHSLDDEFLRIRFGGLVNTSSTSGELVFRISSSGKNWANKICKFIMEFGRATSITVVRDVPPFSSKPMRYYKGRSGVYDRMDVDTFIMQPGNLVIEQKSRLSSLLERRLFADLIYGPYNMMHLLKWKHTLDRKENLKVTTNPVAMSRDSI